MSGRRDGVIETPPPVPGVDLEVLEGEGVCEVVSDSEFITEEDEPELVTEGEEEPESVTRVEEEPELVTGVEEEPESVTGDEGSVTGVEEEPE